MCCTHFKRTVISEISGLREEMKEGDRSLGEEMRAGDAALRSEIHKNKADTIQWMFLLWIGQIGAILEILFAFFK
jgi:hypothetical protein